MTTPTPAPAAPDNTTAAGATPAVPAVPAGDADPAAPAAPDPVTPAPGTTPAADPTGDPPGDGKPDAGPDAVPEAYAAPELPDGVTFDTALAEQLSPILKEANVTQGNFDKLAVAVGEYQQRQWQAIEGAWLDTLSKDAELNANDGALRRAAIAGFGKFGTPEAKLAMETLRWGNHPELVRLIGKLSLAAGVEEDAGTDSAASGGGARSFEERMYPKMKG
jgi:hypothetical protein